MKYFKKICLLVFASLNVFLSAGLHQELKARYCDLIDRYNKGTIYYNPDDIHANRISIDFFKYQSPFREGLNFDVDQISTSDLQFHYLRLMKQIIRGLLYTEESPEYDKPNHPSILKDYTFTMVSGEAFNTIWKLMQIVEKDQVAGDYIEAGVWKGGMAMFMKAFIQAHGNVRHLWVADSFKGFPPESTEPDSKICNNNHMPFMVVPFESVKSNFQRYGLLDDKVTFLKGWFKDTLPTAPIKKLAILRLDTNRYESTRDALEALYPKLEKGGFIIVDDYYYYLGCDRAVDEYRQKHNIKAPMFRQGPTCSGVCWRKSYD